MSIFGTQPEHAEEELDEQDDQDEPTPAVVPYEPPAALTTGEVEFRDQAALRLHRELVIAWVHSEWTEYSKDEHGDDDQELSDVLGAAPNLAEHAYQLADALMLERRKRTK